MTFLSASLVYVYGQWPARKDGRETQHDSHAQLGLAPNFMRTKKYERMQKDCIVLSYKGE